jgi:hypothetical protein
LHQQSISELRLYGQRWAFALANIWDWVGSDHDARWYGFHLTGPGPAEWPTSARRVRRLLAFCQREHQIACRSISANRMIDVSAESLRQVNYNAETLPRLKCSAVRTSIGDPAADRLACKSQLDFDQSIPTLEIRMSHRIGYQLVDGQREPPAPLRLQPQRVRRKYELYVHAIQSGSTRGETELCEVIRSVDESIAIGHFERMMNLGMLMQQLDDIAQRRLDLGVVGSHGRNRDKVDDRGELVIDPVIQLEQKRSLLQGWRKGRENHDISPECPANWFNLPAQRTPHWLL